ncbi:MAG: hypothetical protein IRY99_03445 [Isosphaeraceae bacterium]|nr:hypothetical protein [Isosphaeraceae bacterium]
MDSFFKKLWALLKTVPGSIRGQVNMDELVRVVITALSVGGLAAVPTAILDAIGTIAPQYAAVIQAAVTLVTFILALIHRINQGVDPSQASRREPDLGRR